MGQPKPFINRKILITINSCVTTSVTVVTNSVSHHGTTVISSVNKHAQPHNLNEGVLSDISQSRVGSKPPFDQNFVLPSQLLSIWS